MKTLFLLSVFCTIILVVEVAYSYFKKDGVYSKNGTIGNTINFFALGYVSQKIIPRFLAYFVVWYSWVHYSTDAKSLIMVLCSIVLVDGVYYFFHRLFHKIPLLWEFHSVHHSDDHFNLSTSFRISILEHVTILFFFAPLLFIGVNPFAIFEAVYFLGLYQFITHSSYITFPSWLGYLLVTPQSHRVHHSQNAIHYNKNFGGIFSIWDRVFGTYHSEAKDIAVGIKGYTENNVVLLQLRPFKKVFNKYKE